MSKWLNELNNSMWSSSKSQDHFYTMSGDTDWLSCQCSGIKMLGRIQKCSDQICQVVNILICIFLLVSIISSFLSFLASLKTSHTWTDGADGTEEIPFVRPHPPREPSSDRARRKPRVKSAGKERTPHVLSNIGEDLFYILKWIALTENTFIFIKLLLKHVPGSPICNKSALVHLISGTQPIPEPMLHDLIWVTIGNSKFKEWSEASTITGNKVDLKLNCFKLLSHTYLWILSI